MNLITRNYVYGEVVNNHSNKYYAIWVIEDQDDGSGYMLTEYGKIGNNPQGGVAKYPTVAQAVTAADKQWKKKQNGSGYDEVPTSSNRNGVAPPLRITENITALLEREGLPMHSPVEEKYVSLIDLADSAIQAATTEGAGAAFTKRVDLVAGLERLKREALAAEGMLELLDAIIAGEAAA